MNKTLQIILISLYTIIISVFAMLPFREFRSLRSKNEIVPVDQVKELQINNLKLNSSFIPFLKSINESRIISRGEEYFSLFGLQMQSSDTLQILYEDGSASEVFIRLSKSASDVYFIRLANDESVYEVQGDFSNILNDKPEIDEEYNLIEPMDLTSVIAIKISNNQSSMIIIEDNEHIWIEQLSGVILDRRKVQNLINKIIKMRVYQAGNIEDDFNATHEVILETNDGKIMQILLGLIDNDTVVIWNGSGYYEIKLDKLDFLEWNLKDLQ